MSQDFFTLFESVNSEVDEMGRAPIVSEENSVPVEEGVNMAQIIIDSLNLSPHDSEGTPGGPYLIAAPSSISEHPQWEIMATSPPPSHSQHDNRPLASDNACRSS